MYLNYIVAIVVILSVLILLYKIYRAKRLLDAIILPFKLLAKHKLNTFIWLMFVIIGGQLGTIFNLISRCIIHQGTFQEALAQDSATGSFYTFSIVMFASLIGPLFIQAVNPKQPSYRVIAVVLLTLLIFALLFCSVFYAYTSQLGVEANLNAMNHAGLPIDVAQLLFFCLAVLFSLYSLGFGFFSDHGRETENLSDKSWLSDENKTVDEIKQQANNMTTAQSTNGDLAV